MGKSFESEQLQINPHRRFNPLTGHWVLVSPRRLDRPWLGQVLPETADVPAYDPGCYLCPGNRRATGRTNPRYQSTFLFDNDYPALVPEPVSALDFPDDEGLFVTSGERALCRVLCFSPRHDLSLARMSEDAVTEVARQWVRISTELGDLPWAKYVQIFENRGAMMGCSNPHPHCQVWAVETLPDEPAREQERQLDFLRHHGTCLLCRCLERERLSGSRQVFENAEFAVLVPFWAVWPFETIVVSKRHVSGLSSLDETQIRGLADCLRRLTRCYDGLFQAPMAYSMGFHQAPCDGVVHPEWHLHAHFYPPALRSASIRKYLAGYEMLATPQRDLTPEAAAARLRDAVPALGT